MNGRKTAFQADSETTGAKDTDVEVAGMSERCRVGMFKDYFSLVEHRVWMEE